MFVFFIFVVLTQFHKGLCARSVHSDKGTLWNQFILTFCNHFAHKLTAEPSFLSVEPRPINQPDIWHKAAHCWGRRWWGRGTMQWIHSCEQHVSDQTERKALFKFFFLCLSSPDLSQSLVLILTFDTGSWANTEVEEKTITLSGHKSTGHNSLLIQCVFVNVVNRREKLGKWLSKLAYNYTDIGGSLYEMGGHN